MPEQKKRPAEALPENLTMKFSYCKKCKYPLAIGGLISAASHLSDKGERHDGVLIEIDANESKLPGEKPGDFLNRIMKKYVK